jgi:hypothetical protein
MHNLITLIKHHKIKNKKEFLEKIINLKKIIIKNSLLKKEN